MARVLKTEDGVTHRAVEHRPKVSGADYTFFTALCHDIATLDAFHPMTLGDYQNGPAFEPRWAEADVFIGVPTCVDCAGRG